MALIAEKTAKVTQEHKYVTLLFSSAGVFDKRFARFSHNLLAGYLPTSFHALWLLSERHAGAFQVPGSDLEFVWDLGFGILNFR